MYNNYSTMALHNKNVINVYYLIVWTLDKVSVEYWEKERKRKVRKIGIKGFTIGFYGLQQKLS